MKIDQAIEILKPHAIEVYGSQYKKEVENVAVHTNILQSKSRSIERDAKKMGLNNNDSRAIALCSFRVDSSRKQVYRYIIIPRTDDDNELLYLLSHELFGHAIGNLKNNIKFTTDGTVARYYTGFAYKDFVNSKVMHVALAEGFALYIDKKMCNLMGINPLKYRGYLTRGKILAEEVITFLLEEDMELRKLILDSYIYKNKDINDIVNIGELSEILDVLDNPWYENKCLEKNIRSTIQSKVLLKK